MRVLMRAVPGCACVDVLCMRGRAVHAWTYVVELAAAALSYGSGRVDKREESSGVFMVCVVSRRSFHFISYGLVGCFFLFASRQNADLKMGAIACLFMFSKRTK